LDTPDNHYITIEQTKSEKLKRKAENDLRRDAHGYEDNNAAAAAAPNSYEEDDVEMVDEQSARAALPPFDRRAPRCNLSKDLIEPATADGKLTWDVDLIK
jgi:hypothetical protein